MIQLVEATFDRGRHPVLCGGCACRSSCCSPGSAVSVVIAMVTDRLVWFTKVTVVPTGKATEAFAGIVKVRAFASPDGAVCFPASAATSV